VGVGRSQGSKKIKNMTGTEEGLEMPISPRWPNGESVGNSREVEKTRERGGENLKGKGTSGGDQYSVPLRERRIVRCGGERRDPRLEEAERGHRGGLAEKYKPVER